MSNLLSFQAEGILRNAVSALLFFSDWGLQHHILNDLSLLYCSVSEIRPITSCLHPLEMLTGFRFIKDRIDQNVAVLLLVVGERAKGEEWLEDTCRATCSLIYIVCIYQ